MRWEDVAPTMTTLCYGFGNGRFGHPEQDRAISLREASLFQTFPKTYQFIPKNERANFTVIGRLIGNAVPVRLGDVIAMSLADHLKVVTKAQKKATSGNSKQYNRLSSLQWSIVSHFNMISTPTHTTYTS